MSEENKAAVRRFVEEVWNRGNIAAADEMFASNYVDHNPAGPDLPAGVQGAKQIFTMYRAAFPDLRLTIEDIVAEGDSVAWRWSSRGTHQGALMGIPPTGKQTAITGIEVYRMSGGKIAERWGNLDMLGLLQQLGAIPTPGS